MGSRSRPVNGGRSGLPTASGCERTKAFGVKKPLRHGPKVSWTRRLQFRWNPGHLTARRQPELTRAEEKSYAVRSSKSMEQSRSLAPRRFWTACRKPGSNLASRRLLSCLRRDPALVCSRLPGDACRRVPARHGGDLDMLIEHLGRRPAIDRTARIAPTAVICGDVTVGPETSIGFGAVLTAESGPIVVGRQCVIMENAVAARDGTRRPSATTSSSAPAPTSRAAPSARARSRDGLSDLQRRHRRRAR